MVYFIDTNIFLRVLVKENEETFKECSKILNLVRQNKISVFTSSLVLSEIEWVLESFYNFEKQKVITALESIINLKALKVVDKFNPRLALEIFQKKNVKFVDALIASNPAIFQKKVIIVSYDKDFDKISIKRAEPKEIR